VCVFLIGIVPVHRGKTVFLVFKGQRGILEILGHGDHKGTQGLKDYRELRGIRVIPGIPVFRDQSVHKDRQD
jgi:hypothetical protein